MKTNSKGQAAFETIFVVLFVILAVSALMTAALNYKSNIGEMATARAIAQGVALELSLGKDPSGPIQTHLVRIDKDSLSPRSNYPFVLYVKSENCSKAKAAFQATFQASFGASPFLEGTPPGDWKCEGDLYKN